MQTIYKIFDQGADISRLHNAFEKRCHEPDVGNTILEPEGISKILRIYPREQWTLDTAAHITQFVLFCRNVVVERSPMEMKKAVDDVYRTFDPENPDAPVGEAEAVPVEPAEVKVVFSVDLQRNHRSLYVGDRIRTTGNMACYRHAENDYRCYKIGLSRNALVIASEVTPEKQAILDEYCFTMVRANKDQRCGFNIEFDIEAKGPDHTETIIVYRTTRMELLPRQQRY